MTKHQNQQYEHLLAKRNLWEIGRGPKLDYSEINLWIHLERLKNNSKK